MSDQSDQIMEIIQALSEELDAILEGGSKVIKVDDGPIEALLNRRVPSHHAAMHFYVHEARTAAQTLVRHWLGAEPFSSAEEAVMRTQEDAKTEMMALLYRIFSDGVQLGQGTSHVVRKYRWLNQEEQIYSYRGFRQESELLAFRFSSDFDTIELFEHHWRAAQQNTLDGTGFMHFDAEEANKKIWDLWAMAALGGFTQLFLCGFDLGRKWADADVLDGILSATAERDDT